MSETKTGKGKYGTRKTFMVQRVDTKKLQAIFEQYQIAVYGKLFGEYAVEHYVAVPIKGKLNRGKQEYALVMSEGVGFMADDDYSLVTFYAQSWGSVAQAKVAHFRIEEELLTNEWVDLADWIGTFGDRLEGNFELWYNKATNYGKDEL